MTITKILCFLKRKFFGLLRYLFIALPCSIFLRCDPCEKDKIFNKLALIKYALNKKRFILIHAWCFFENGKLLPNNLGDDLNFFLIEKMTGRKIILYKYPETRLSAFFNFKRFSFIGSILTFYPLKNVIVWGSGIQKDGKNPSLILPPPLSILAVRGPLTQKELENQGVVAPKVFGDPALLLPLYYTPKIKSKKKIGIIPHFIDMEEKIIQEFKNDERFSIIPMKNYTSIEETLDEIASCEIVFSSSLHGIIIAYAYKVRSVWVEFSPKIDGWDFKFKDFFASIDSDCTKPIKISSVDEALQLSKNPPAQKMQSEEKRLSQIQNLLDTFPLPLKSKKC